MKHILFIESRDYLPGVKYCKENGWKVTLISDEPEYYNTNPLFSQIDHVIKVKTQNVDSVVEFVKSYNESNKLNAVLSFSELYVIQATAAAYALGLQTMNPLTTSNARNKYYMRTLCKQNNIPIPDFVLLNPDNYQKILNDIKFPCVIKPCIGASSKGVKWVSNESELRYAFNEYSENHYFGRGLYGDVQMMIEEYLEGNIISVETLTYNYETTVIGISDRILIGFPYFVEAGASFPVEIPEYKEIVEIVMNCIKNLNVNMGACHTEVVLTKDGPKIIELNPRMGGGPIYELILNSTGIDLVKEIIKIHLGEFPDLTKTICKAAAAKYFFADHDGLFDSFIPDDLHLYKNIIKFETHHLNKHVTKPKSNFDSLAELIISGDNLHDAKQKLNYIEGKIRFNII